MLGKRMLNACLLCFQSCGWAQSGLVPDIWTDNYQISGLLEKPPKQTWALSISSLSFILWGDGGGPMLVWENQSKRGMRGRRRLQVGGTYALVVRQGEVGACVRVWRCQIREQWRQRVSCFSERSRRVTRSRIIWNCGFWQCFRLNVFVHIIS